MSNYQTQWTAQFLIAAELTSRGYLVNFSLGNAKFTDIQAETPEGKQFAVDVKGQKTKSYWQIKGRIHKANQYYILGYVPQSKESQTSAAHPAAELRGMKKRRLHLNRNPANSFAYILLSLPKFPAVQCSPELSQQLHLHQLYQYIHHRSKIHRPRVLS